MDWEAGQGHYPYQSAIDAYGNGGFRFADMSHKGSLIGLPSGMYAWDVNDPADITLASLSRVMDAADEVDVLLIGTGPDIAAIPSDIRDAFRERGVIVEAVATGSAVRTYNVLMNEKRAVAAALIAVEKAR
ncbi:Mth938-like domain-containing protein [Pelagibacterium luteolum]|uniref:Uncharacterized conserved protein, contains Mth938-like domain n=1 Tax=Pelagibacterium luteolum TaxID=440168 RepID=A0A1G7VYP9_9HYPH|nr:MTH938/NDUFAF3 family protein [Pelagibacterium luteolum]SDG64896.1 Uncharacterized conserved protein, contains Mth938-like domain [Pelagibacterium luteolum]